MSRARLSKRGIPGIEPGTSRTRSEHNATIPNPRGGMSVTVSGVLKYSRLHPLRRNIKLNRLDMREAFLTGDDVLGKTR